MSTTRQLHPATQLLGWAGFVLFLQSVAAWGLAWTAVVALPLAALLAGSRTWILIRRTRWLLASIAVLFVLATPGERLPGIPGDIGITRDGLVLAAEHVLRLAILLATLAVLHERLRTGGIVAGLHWLLGPLARWRALRERIVVRLMLVLDYVEAPGRRDWRSWLSERDAAGPDQLRLEVRPIRALDWTILAILAALAMVATGNR